MMKLLGSLLLIVAIQTACFQKKTVEKSLLRGVQATQVKSTCQLLLPDGEYATLVQQLTSNDPLYVVSTNDLHGHADERTVTLNSDEKSHDVKIGGMERLAMYLSALCRQSKGRLIYLDAGDSYQGTAISNNSKGLAIVNAFSTLGLMASTFGNHEFDFGQEQIKDWLKNNDRTFWYVTSSVKSEIDDRSIPWSELQAPRFSHSAIFDVAGLKVGVAGYTTDSTSVKSIPSNIKALQFQGLIHVLQSEAAPLRKQGAEIVILLSHAGGSCNMKLPANQGDTACKDSQSDELGQALRSGKIEPGDWNLIVAGHSHAAQRHFINSIPVVQTTGLGQSMTLAILSRNGKQTKVELKNPVYLCEKHFENFQGCHPEEYDWLPAKPKSLGNQKEPKVESQPINATDAQRVLAVLKPWRERLKSQMNKVLITFPVALEHERTARSPAGACLVDAWLEELKASNETWGGISSHELDGAFLNAGALRNGISAGALTWGRLFEIIPYDNTALIVRLDEDSLTALARTHEASPHDYLLASSNWIVTRSGNSSPAPRTRAVKKTITDPTTQATRVVAISTFSKSFLERAKITSKVYDSGLSIRESIARSLANQKEKLKSCLIPDPSRMRIEE